MHTIVMYMGIDTKRYQQIALQKPGHASSSSASIFRTVSAAIGRFPREITKPFRFEGCPERRWPRFVLPGNDRRSNRFTAAQTVQSSALASALASAYRSGSRLTVNLMSPIVVQWCRYGLS
jgi:hypothetical protein